MILYSLPFDIIQDALLYLDIVDLTRLEIAGPKNQFRKQYLEVITENYSVGVYFHGSRTVPMPLNVLLRYIDQNITFTDLVLSDTNDSAPVSYSDKFKYAASVLKFLSIPCQNTFQEQELLACSLRLEYLRLYNESMSFIKFHTDLEFDSVTSLNLSGCLNLQDFSHAIYGFRNLTYLNVSHCYKLKTFFLVSSVRFATKLEILNMCHCPLLSEGVLVEVSRVSSIKYLGVVGCNFSEGVLSMVASQCPNFIGFLEDEPLPLRKIKASSFTDRWLEYYDSILLPRMDKLYLILHPYSESSTRYFMLLMMFQPKFSSDQKWSRLCFISLVFAFGVFKAFISFMQHRNSRTMQWLDFAGLSFSLVVFCWSVWFVYWEQNETKPLES